MNDLRFAFRMLARNPGFTAMAVLSLAVGIGINCTVFSGLDAAFLRPIPFKDPKLIVSIESPRFSYPDYRELSGQCRSLSGVVAVSRHAGVLRRQEGTETLPAEVVSPNYFSVLGIGAAAGNVFSEQDPRLRSYRLVVISYQLWHSHFGGDPGIVGKTISLNFRDFTVLGVVQRGYDGASRFPKTDLWFPVDKDSGMESREYRDFFLLGRRVPTASEAQVQAEVQTIVSRLGLKEPTTGRPERVIAWSEARSSADHGGKLAILIMAFVGLVLLVACANVSGMLLARNEERRHEIAVRLALGADHWRLIRQLLVESLLLAALGAVFGLLLTGWAKGALLTLIPSSYLQFVPEPRLDYRVLALSVVLVLLATIAFGLAPAWRAARTNLAATLKGEAALATNRWRRLRGRNLLVVGQLAVSVVFLMTAGLLAKGFLRGLAVDLGFERKEVLQVLMPSMGGQAGRQYYAQLTERVRALPGVKQVSLATRAPLSLWGGGATEKVFLAGDEAPANAQGRATGFNCVAPNYFQMMGIRLLRGRSFNERDDESAARVVIISDGMARRYWPGQDPIGRAIRIGNEQGPTAVVVGVARDVVRNQIGETPEPFLYLPIGQRSRSEVTLLVETSGDAAAVLGLVRREMRALSSEVVPLFVDTQRQVVRTALFPQWAGAWLFGGLGLLAFVMATAGLYGLVSYSVARRTHEIGVRMALGAQAGDTMRMILRQGLVLALIGLAIGFPVSFALGRLLRSMLFGLSPADPATFLGATIVVIGIALLAGYFPARRAAKVAPMEALRYE